MSNAQGWVALTILLAFAGIIITLVLRLMESIRDAMRSDIAGLRTEMVARFDGTDARITNLDRDVQALTQRVFRDPA